MSHILISKAELKYSCHNMKLIIVLISFAVFAHGFRATSKGLRSFSKDNQNKVVGGHNAKLGQFPYQASLQRKGGEAEGHYCGGSLITVSTVLTAGHCVTDLHLDPEEHIEVHMGFISLSDPGDTEQFSTVKKTIVHPDFEGGVNPNDVAVHIVTTPFILNEFVSLISLPLREIIPLGNTTLSGWGSTSHSSSPIYPDILQTVNLPIVPFEECKEAIAEIDRWSTLTETMVCTGPLTGGFSSCDGDSGGPLVAGPPENLTIVGIVSWGFLPCPDYGNPSVYTNPSSFLDFIHENMV